jgi:hypothetical protein
VQSVVDLAHGLGCRSPPRGWSRRRPPTGCARPAATRRRATCGAGPPVAVPAARRPGLGAARRLPPRRHRRTRQWGARRSPGPAGLMRTRPTAGDANGRLATAVALLCALTSCSTPGLGRPRTGSTAGPGSSVSTQFDQALYDRLPASVRARG